MRNVKEGEPNLKVFCSPSILKHIFLQREPRLPLQSTGLDTGAVLFLYIFIYIYIKLYIPIYIYMYFIYLFYIPI